MNLGPFQAVPDATSTQWLSPRLDPFGADVGSLVPRGYEAYARLFHPAFKADTEGGAATPVTWQQIAEANGRSAHPRMQFPHVTNSWENWHGQPGVFDIAPIEGSLPVRYAERLLQLLDRFTATPRHCWFGCWTGYGSSRLATSATATFELPQRTMYLLTGPLGSLAQSICAAPVYQTVNICWPDDRAWVVATDIDLESTYVAGSLDCIEALLDVPDLEAMACDAGDPIAFSSDTINPAPPGEPY
jgi:hypothetical protein